MTFSILPYIEEDIKADVCAAFPTVWQFTLLTPGGVVCSCFIPPYSVCLNSDGLVFPFTSCSVISLAPGKHIQGFTMYLQVQKKNRNTLVLCFPQWSSHTDYQHVNTWLGFCPQSFSGGVVPYLGTYLTVLTMLDTALTDTVEVSTPHTHTQT